MAKDRRNPRIDSGGPVAGISYTYVPARLQPGDWESIENRVTTTIASLTQASEQGAVSVRPCWTSHSGGGGYLGGGASAETRERRDEGFRDGDRTPAAHRP